MASLEQPAWSSVDNESLDLILSLLCDDASQVRSTSKGKQAEGTLSDGDLALQLYTEELQRATMYVSDRRMTKSVQDAVQTDTTVLLESEWLESLARHDRDIAAAQFAGRPQGQAQAPVNTGLSATELETWEKLTSKYIIGIDGVESDDSFYDCTDTASTETDGQPESSSWAASRGKNKSHQRQCIGCLEAKSSVNLTRVPCEHAYCGECLEHLFRNAMFDESLFPPRCCRLDIPVDENRLFLGDDLVEQFAQKSIELSTPNRTYCHQPTCSAFIPPSMIKDGVARCPECKTQTCETCKGATHRGDCPSDTGLQQVLEVARQERWQRCPQCFNMIELNTGCFHITCKCRAQFCYLCAARWKNCECAHWDEARLYTRAEEIYNRDHNPDDDDDVDEQAHVAVANPANPQPPQSAAGRHRALGIGRIMEHLVQHHECDHDRWIGRRGPRECEECGDEMPLFIYECRQCSLMACRRCRYNRL
ncbi:hypothetical protein F4824DRAFT_423230 [Ustulina deusta]|nr:hypothetical protein F4824DRAFT_423230 [Ustulina deusta]